MANALVSVCMPAYNAEKYILESVNSVIEQSYQNWELIIVNDGSTDNTNTQLEKITDSRVKIHQQKNKGQCAAANAAFSFSKGGLIKFMDADDLISKDLLKSQVEVIAGSDNVIASASWGRFYNNDISSFQLQEATIDANSKPIDWLVSSMTDKQVMLQCALWLIPRPVLERSGLWDESLSLINDFEFFIRVLLYADEIRCAPNAVLYYRSGLTQSLSGLRSRVGAESAFNSISLGTEHLLNHENSARVRKIAADSFQYFVHDFYPNHLELIEKAEKKVAELGGSDVEFIAGGVTRRLSSILGWKASKKLKTILGKSK